MKPAAYHKESPKKPQQPKEREKTIRWLLISILAITLLLAVAGIGFLVYILKDLPSPDKLSSYNIPQTTKIFDRNGTVLYEIFTDQNRTIVKLSDIPMHLQQATIAIEDKDFYRHSGVSLIGGVLRAIKENLIHDNLQGGSTITQQLVKTALLTPKRTVTRKVREIVLAFWTERLYSKDQILEMYLNQVPYGGTTWGIEAAAETYFGKHTKDLTIAESALLAGLPAAPTLYSPYGAHPEYAKQRQEDVLNRMLVDGYITQDQARQASEESVPYQQQHITIKAPHFVMYVKEQLVQKYGEKVVEQGGLRVTTTLDLSLQEMAQQTVASEVAKLASLRVGNGASVITRPPTGEILAMVGSKDFFASDSGNFNVATSLRQPGSSIKPLNFAVGLDTKKVNAATLFLDTPTCFPNAGQKAYCPGNYDGRFHGPTQLRFALGNSFNIPAVKMMAMNTTEVFIASASAFGISSFTDPSRYGLSLTLGAGEVTMLDMSRSFGVFANAGIRKDLVAVLKVEDAHGKVLEQFSDPHVVINVQEPIPAPSSLLINGPRVISAETSFLISHILLDKNARTQAFGGGSFLDIAKHAVSVKTGTTDVKRDNWTIGYTPNFLVTVWVGNNDNTPMHPSLTSGLTGAAPIWNKIMTELLKSQPDLWPKQPADIVGANVCSLSGLMPPNGDPASPDRGCPTRYEYFIKGALPKGSEVLKRTVAIDKTTNTLAKPGQTENVEMQEKQIVSDTYGIYCLDCNNDTPGGPTMIRL